MFGTNAIIGRKEFKDLEWDQLKVTSIFYTLQGEGPFSGQRAVFVRLAHCNLDCSFCDTFFDAGDVLSHTDIMSKIYSAVAEFHGFNLEHAHYSKALDQRYDITGILKSSVLVLTGGEPLLQKNIVEFIKRLSPHFKAVQIETNGLLWVEGLGDTKATIVCSPKCSEKTGKYLTPNKEIMSWANCFKFVVSADSGSPYHNIPDWAEQDIQNRDIYISPMNIYNDIPLESKKVRLLNKELSLEERSKKDEIISFWETGLLNMEENQKNHEYAARYCMKNGFKLNLQMHLYASLA